MATLTNRSGYTVRVPRRAELERTFSHEDLKGAHQYLKELRQQGHSPKLEQGMSTGTCGSERRATPSSISMAAATRTPRQPPRGSRQSARPAFSSITPRATASTSVLPRRGLVAGARSLLVRAPETMRMALMGCLRQRWLHRPSFRHRSHMRSARWVAPCRASRPMTAASPPA